MKIMVDHSQFATQHCNKKSYEIICNPKTT